MTAPRFDISYPDLSDIAPLSPPRRISATVLSDEYAAYADHFENCHNRIPGVRWEMTAHDAESSADLAITLHDPHHCDLHGKLLPFHTLSLTCHGSESYSDSLFLIAHGIVAPAIAVGLIGVDWHDVSEVLIRGRSGRLDALKWNADTSLLIPTETDNSNAVAATLAVLLNPLHSMANIRFFLSELKRQLPRKVFLIPAAPACTGTDSVVLILRIYPD